MKKLRVMAISFLVLVGCATNNASQEETNVKEEMIIETQETKIEQEETVDEDSKEVQEETANVDIHIPVTIKESPDKYTAYIKDYVGKNCASIGYKSMGGNRMDYYSKGYIELNMLTEDGEYLDTSDDFLKEYMVVAQSLEPNTEVKLVYDKDDQGNEYENLVKWMSIRDIVLKVKRIGDTRTTTETGLTPITVSLDQYTAYIKDYTGRNLANCGYISLGGGLRDEYSMTNLALKIIAVDGSFVEMDKETIKEYKVIQQSPEPNTKVSFEFQKTSSGEELSLPSWRSIEEIELYVVKIDN